jgi:hypothetical protein
MKAKLVEMFWTGIAGALVLAMTLALLLVCGFFAPFRWLLDKLHTKEREKENDNRGIA